MRAGARCRAVAEGLTSLQPVDILSVEPQKLPLVVQQSQEVVDDVGPVLPRVQLLGPREKGLGIVEVIGELKNGLGVGDAVQLQFAVPAALLRPATGRKRL